MTSKVSDMPRCLFCLMLLFAFYSGFVGPAAGESAEKSDAVAERILDETSTTGGLVVHLNCHHPSAEGLTAALRADDSFLVQGLTGSDADVNRLRGRLSAGGLYGPVSVSLLVGDRLPYTDNLVRLVVVSGKSPVAEDEIRRVLSPGGDAVFLDADGRIVSRLTKPWPTDTDQWTHFLHDSDNNPVSTDTRVGPPRRFQWIGGPLWSRSHEHAPSIVGGVTAGGRMFYMEDEGPRGIIDTRIPEKWSLVARDAFSGKILWRRSVPSWLEGFHYWLRYPVEDNRRMVASAGRVYLCPGPEEPVLALDAATGAVEAEYREAAGSTQLLLKSDVLLAVGEELVAIDTKTGDTLWKHPVAVTGLNLACNQSNAILADRRDLVCLDLKSGAVNWRTNLVDVLAKNRVSSITLFGDRIYLALSQGNYDVAAFSAADGEMLWRTTDSEENRKLYFVSPRELFVTEEAVWASVSGHGLDPLTGAVKTISRVDQTGGHHQRCHLRKATTGFIIGGKRGIEIISYQPDTPTIQNDWVRGGCRLGVVPANGMLYVPPEACFCCPGVMVKGFKALVADDAVSAPAPIAPDARLKKGPAYNPAVYSLRPTASQSFWPMYRHDARRSGCQLSGAPRELSQKWKTALGGRITQPVVAGGLVFVAQKDEHAVHALNQETGRTVWTFVADGRIDSSPTWHDGRLYFGCTDGEVYCLGASDGTLAWRFHAAPAVRSIVSFEQIESVWPVAGSLIVKDRRAYCAAGRSSFLDGGITLWALDAASGEPLARRTVHTEQGQENIDAFHTHHISEGGNTDLLVFDGEHFHMGIFQFDADLNPIEMHESEPYGQAPTNLHLASSSGLLDETGHNRSHWTYWSSWPGAHYSTYAPKSGQILAFNDEITYSAKTYDFLTLNQKGKTPLNAIGAPATTENLPASLDWLSRSPTHHPGGSVSLLADRNDNEPQTPGNFRELGGGFSRVAPPVWSRTITVRPRAMLLTPDTLYVAGPPHHVEPSDPHATYENRAGATLGLYATADGRSIDQVKLDHPPAFDALSAADGKLFMADTQGQVICWGPLEP